MGPPGPSDGGNVGGPSTTFTVIALLAGTIPSASRLPESSTLRTLTTTVPVPAGVHSKDQLLVPVIVTGCQLIPPSIEISIPAITPPVSFTVPEMVVSAPTTTLLLLAGELITD